MSKSLYVNWAIAFYTNKFDKDQKNWTGSKIASEATRVNMKIPLSNVTGLFSSSNLRR